MDNKIEDGLNEYALAQYNTLVIANKRIAELEAENNFLKNELSLYKDNKTEIIIKSAEEQVCELEIMRLRNIAQNGPLDLEETKQFDLYVKNLYLAKGKPNTLENGKKKKKKLSEAELIQLVQLTNEET